MRALSFFCTAVFVSLPSFAAEQAVVEGRVELPKSHVFPVVTKRYQVVTKAGVVATDPALAVIYLEGPFSRTAPTARAQMAQKDLAFATPLLPVQVGTTVEFPNYDDAYHNIFSYSSPKRFDLGRFRPDEKPIPSQVFNKPGLVVLHCDIHEHMRGIILVLETPYFTKSDPDGRFKLGGLPAGNYKLKAWVDSKTTMERSVELKSGATLHVDFP